MNNFATSFIIKKHLKKSIAILGSTGSIGTQAIEVCMAHSDNFDIEVLTANSNHELLIAQALQVKPNTVVIADTTNYALVKDALEPHDIKVFAGNNAIAEVVQMDSIDIVLTAMVGYSGLLPTINAIKAGKSIALANKETLVVAGALINELAQKHGVNIYPVDSEHSAIFQSLAGAPMKEVRRLILTASGGPFYLKKDLDLSTVKKEQALKHPNWSMGNKITIDSATLMNKGLELIEASYLFGFPSKLIDVIVHPQSTIHSLVHYTDGSVLAQLGTPDMRIPISYALTWPDRAAVSTARLDLAKLSQLTFEAPDPTRFPALRLARSALDRGAAATTALSAANEIAVEAFLDGRIRFLDISNTVEEALSHLEGAEAGLLAKMPSSFDEVKAVDQAARRAARLIAGNPAAA